MYAISTFVVVVLLFQVWTKGEKDGPDRKYGGLCKLYDPTNKRVNNVDFDCQTALFSKHDYGLEGILYMILNHDLCSISNLDPVISAIEAMHAKVIASRRHGTVVDVIVPPVATIATNNEEDDVIPVVDELIDDDACNEDANDGYDDYGNYKNNRCFSSILLLLPYHKPSPYSVCKVTTMMNTRRSENNVWLTRLRRKPRETRRSLPQRWPRPRKSRQQKQLPRN